MKIRINFKMNKKTNPKIDAKTEIVTEIVKLLDDIKSIRIAVIVEGKKDVGSLRKLGISRIISLDNRPLYKVVDEIIDNHKTIAILTDLDAEGKKLYSLLQHQLKKNGVKVDNQLREFLFKNTKLRQIEGLASFVASHT